VSSEAYNLKIFVVENYLLIPHLVELLKPTVEWEGNRKKDTAVFIRKEIYSRIK